MSASPVEFPDETGYAIVDQERRLDLPELIFLPEGDEVTVGRPDLDLYVLLPADGAALLHRLAAGGGVRKAADWYAETYGEPVDMENFVLALDDLGFLAPAPEKIRSAVRFRRLGTILFGPAGWCLYAALLIAGAVFLMRRPELRPAYRHLFFSQSVMVIEFTIFLGQVPGVALHESFHALAGRRLGLRSTLRVGRRLYYLVMETSMDGLVGVPRSQRYLPILAGMLADVVWFSVLTLIAGAGLGRPGAMGDIARICLCLAFATMLRFLWQFQFYLRTDLYVLVGTALGLNDLHGAAWFRLRHWLDRIRAAGSGRSASPARASAWSDRELWHAGWYGPLMLLGYGISILTVALVVLPTTAKLIELVAGRLISPHRAGAGGVIDSAVFVVVNVVQVVLVVVLSRRAAATRSAAGTP